MSHSPNFFVIGVAKGGTTSLHHYLNQHPEVYLPPIKETNHYALGDIDEGQLHPVYRRDIQLDIDAYIAQGMKRPIHIAHVNEEKHYRALFAPAGKAQAVGEISNSYSICPSAIPAIRAKHPDARIIIMLRNPIQRAWSHYLMNLREGKNDHTDFIQEVELDRAQKVIGWGMNHQYLELGRYYNQMKRVYNYFPKEQIKWLLFEDFKADPASTLLQITRFLEVDTDYHFDFNKKANSAQVPRNKYLNRLLIQSGVLHQLKAMAGTSARTLGKKLLYSNGSKLPTISAEVSAYLHEFYRNDVLALSTLLNFNFIRKWNME